tara:strand:- start:439 stop:648 length:210 start_codon:yes stop_codon:yes gene_type:complete
MNVGDLVRITNSTTLEKSSYNSEESKVAMIIEGPNEAGKIKLLLQNGQAFWKHASEVEYVPKGKRYLHD